MSQHLSRSERTILALRQRIAELEQMQAEYNAFLNYVIYYHTPANKEGESVFVIESDWMKKLKCLPIKSEIVDNGKRMELRRVDTGSNNKPVIVLPA